MLFWQILASAFGFGILCLAAGLMLTHDAFRRLDKSYKRLFEMYQDLRVENLRLAMKTGRIPDFTGFIPAVGGKTNPITGPESESPNGK